MYVLAGTPNMYSKPRLLMTSTMKSEPGFSMVFASSTTSAAGAAAGLARIGAVAFVGAGAACWAPASPGLVTARAALAAAVFRKLRRFTDFDFAFLAMEAHPPVPCRYGPDCTLETATASILFSRITTPTKRLEQGGAWSAIP